MIRSVGPAHKRRRLFELRQFRLDFRAEIFGQTFLLQSPIADLFQHRSRFGSGGAALRRTRTVAVGRIPFLGAIIEQDFDERLFQFRTERAAFEQSFTGFQQRNVLAMAKDRIAHPTRDILRLLIGRGQSAFEDRDGGFAAIGCEHIDREMKIVSVRMRLLFEKRGDSGSNGTLVANGTEEQFLSVGFGEKFFALRDEVDRTDGGGRAISGQRL